MILAALAEEVHTCYVVFPPDEAIGVGAEWDVTRQVVGFGTRYQQTTTFELVEVDDAHARAKFRIAYTSPSQAVSDSERVRSTSGSAEGEVVIDFARPLPRTSRFKGSLEIDVMVSERGTSYPAQVTKSFEAEATRAE